MARLAFLALMPALALASGDAASCVHGQHGPACKSDADCTSVSNCVRCAHSGFCTDTPLGPSPGPSPGPPSGCTMDDKSFDFFLLVQGWPASGCINTHCVDSYASITDRFTIHGLWPSRGGKAVASYPCECDKRGFDESQVSSIRKDLEQNWASFKGDTGFWEHEWTKHGTCCSNFSRLATEFDFFNTTLELRQSYDIFDGLKKAGIAPSNDRTYTAQEIIAALKPVGGGFAPTLGCQTSGGKQLLHEIAFCFDKTLATIECDAALSALPNEEVADCDASKPITFIPAKPQNILAI